MSENKSRDGKDEEDRGQSRGGRWFPTASGFDVVMSPGQTQQEHASNVGGETRTFLHKGLLPVSSGLLSSLLQTAGSLCQKHSCPLQEEK